LVAGKRFTNLFFTKNNKEAFKKNKASFTPNAQQLAAPNAMRWQKVK